MLGYISKSMLYVISACVVGAVYRTILLFYYRKKGVRINVLHEIGVGLLILYLSIMFANTISLDSRFNGKFQGSINLIPFASIGSMLLEVSMAHNINDVFLNIIGSIVMFVPLGFLLPLLWKRYRKLARTFSVGFETSMCIELYQLFLIKETDIDDIILNTLGIMAGFFIFCCVRKVSYKWSSMGLLKKEKDAKVPFILKLEADTLIIGMIIVTTVVGAYKSQKVWEKLNEESVPLAEASVRKYVNIPEQQGAPEIEARNAILMAEDGTVVYEKGGEERIAPASTAKLLTALTVLEYAGKEEEVIVGDEIKMVSPDASRAGLYEGEEMNVRMLLEALLLPSGNDAAYTLANYIGQKTGKTDSKKEAVAYFIELMNDEADELGASDSRFLNPDGYDKEGQYTTAYDLALIGRAAMQNEIIREIVGYDEVREILLDGTDVTFHNSNELINPASEYYYPEAEGLKTGSTDLAGKCLISAVYNNNQLYISVVMGTDTEEARFEDSISLLEYSKEIHSQWEGETQMMVEN